MVALTVHAAQKLSRKWIGIDITHLAISLIEKRMKDAFPGISFEVHGVPKDFDGAVDLAKRDKYQFQWWACSLVNAQPYQGKKKGSDTGIDGLIFALEDPDESPEENHRIRQGRGSYRIGHDSRSEGRRRKGKGDHRPVRHPDRTDQGHAQRSVLCRVPRGRGEAVSQDSASHDQGATGRKRAARIF